MGTGRSRLKKAANSAMETSDLVQVEVAKVSQKIDQQDRNLGNAMNKFSTFMDEGRIATDKIISLSEQSIQFMKGENLILMR